MITLWIVWTLLSGQPVDANVYMTEAMCQTQISEAKEMLVHAKAQHPNVPDFELAGCFPIQVPMADVS